MMHELWKEQRISMETLKHEAEREQERKAEAARQRAHLVALGMTSGRSRIQEARERRSWERKALFFTSVAMYCAGYAIGAIARYLIGG